MMLKILFTLLLVIFRVFLIIKVAICLYDVKYNPNYDWSELNWYLGIMILDYYCIRLIEKDEN